MAQLQLDLSGINGLVPRFYGDKPNSASSPNLRYFGNNGQLAEGVCNPISVLGYLSPANGTTKAVTGTTDFLLSSYLVSHKRLVIDGTDSIFFADEATTGTAGQVVNLDTAIDTSLDSNFSATTVTNPTPTFKVTYGDTNKDGMAFAVLAAPAASTRPSVIYTAEAESSSGASLTKSITVPSGTNKAMYVLTWNRDASSSNNATGATWDGNAMTASSSGTYSPAGGTKINWNVFRYINPSATTGDVVVSWAGSENNLGLLVVVVDNADQTTPFTGFTSDSATNASEHEISVSQTASNQLRLGFFLTESTTHTRHSASITEIFNNTDTSGRYSGWTYALDSQYFKVEDMIKYQQNSEPKIYFAHTNTTNNGYFDTIGVADEDFSNADYDWSADLSTGPSGANTTLLTGESRVRFVLGDNGFLYVLNGNMIHRIDGGTTGGATGTITQQVVQFLGKPSETGNAITQLQDGVDVRGKIWVGLHIDSNTDRWENSSSGKSFPQFVGVYVWNKVSSLASMQDFIPIYGVRELKSMHVFQGKPACFTISTDGYTQFRVWDGNTMKNVQTLGENAFPNYGKHSVYEDGDLIYWFGNDGKVYAFGRIDPTIQSNALYIIGDMTGEVSDGETFSKAGVLAPLNASETVTSGKADEPLAFYLSFSDTAGNHLKKWYPFSTGTVSSNAQTAHQGDVYSRVEYLPFLSNVKGLTIYCAPGTNTGTTTVATLKIYVNQGTTPAFTKTVTQNDVNKGYIYIQMGKRYVNAIQVEIEWSTSLTTGADDFLPSVGVLEYDQEQEIKGKTGN